MASPDRDRHYGGGGWDVDWEAFCMTIADVMLIWVAGAVITLAILVLSPTLFMSASDWAKFKEDALRDDADVVNEGNFSPFMSVFKFLCALCWPLLLWGYIGDLWTGMRRK
jgi:hypothetical protein